MAQHDGKLAQVVPVPPPTGPGGEEGPEEAGGGGAPEATHAGLAGDVAATQSLPSRLRGDDPRSGLRIERAKLLGYLRKRREMYRDCVSLPFTLAFFVIFFVLVLWHFQHQTVYRVTEAVVRAVPTRKTLEASHPAALWSWLEGRAERADAARYNRLVGGVYVVRTPRDTGEYSLRTLCGYSELDFVMDFASTGGGNIRQDRKNPDICRSVSDVDGGDAAWLPWALGREDVAPSLERIRSWWVFEPSPGGADGDRTVPVSSPERVEVRMLAYNSKLDFYVIYRLFFNVRSSGKLEVTVRANAFDAHPPWLDLELDLKKSFSHVLVLIMDFVFLFMAVGLMVSQVWDIFRRICSHGFFRGLWKHVSVWNLIDWSSIFMAASMLTTYLYCNFLTSGLLSLAEHLPEVDDQRRYTRNEFESLLVEAGQSWAQYLRSLDAAHEQAVLVARARDDLRWYACVFAATVCLRFFKALRANPRLNIVVQSLKKASVDLAHFLIIFGLIFLGFVLVGHTVFGGQLASFSTIGEALYTTFLLLMGFAFDEYKEKMLSKSGVLGVIWTAVFNLVLVLLLLNIVVAIIFDVYTEVKADAAEAPSLLQQTIDVLFGRSRQAKRLADKVAQTRIYSKEGTEQTESQSQTDSMAANLSVAPEVLADLKAAQAKWSEYKLLKAITGLPADPGDQYFSVDSLCTALGVESAAEQLQLEVILEQAAEQKRTDKEAMSLTESVRLSGRIDANVRELGVIVTNLIERAEPCPGASSATTGAVAPSPPPKAQSLAVPREPWDDCEPEVENFRCAAGVTLEVEDIDEACLGAPPTMVEAESPEPEPPVEQLPGIEVILEERLSKATQAQAERHLRLEEQLGALVARLGLHHVWEQASPQADKLDRLEEQVNRLSRKLQPVLDSFQSSLEAAEDPLPGRKLR